MCFDLIFLLGLNTFFILIFVAFVADKPLDRMFKMVLILTECLKWSLFSHSCFIWSFSMTPFKLVTEHGIGGTGCITLH